MTNTICVDQRYSTTRMAIQTDPTVFANEVKQSGTPEDKLQTVLFLSDQKSWSPWRRRSDHKDFLTKEDILRVCEVMNGWLT